MEVGARVEPWWAALAGGIAALLPAGRDAMGMRESVHRCRAQTSASVRLSQLRTSVG